MNKDKFDSQICTTRKQSQRLLALGLKPETADMVYHFTGIEDMQWELKTKPPTAREGIREALYDKLWGKDVPAWSLSRLLDIIPKYIPKSDGLDLIFAIDIYNNEWFVSYKATWVCAEYRTRGFNLYGVLILIIEKMIKEGYIDKEYIKE